MSDEQKDTVERALEILVFAPLGAGLCVKDAAPSLVERLITRGRAEIDRRRVSIGERVTSVRSTGQVAITFGVPKLRVRVERRLSEACQRAEELLARGPAAEVPIAEVTEVPAPDKPLARAYSGVAAVASTAAASAAASVPPAPSTYSADTPRSDGLSIPGYDALSASQVVERLAGLGRDDLDAVQAYEAAHRQRRTILGKIEQLAG